MEIVEVSNIRKEYGTLAAVNDVSFSLGEGHVLGLIGPNGAGKTTLLRILATVLRLTSGSVNLLGFDSAKQYLDIRKRIGYLPDFFNLYHDLTISECLDFFARAYEIDASTIPSLIDEVLNYIDLWDKRDDLIQHLSRGMVQRMGVGALLVHKPDIYLLDEPASGLDPKARIQLREILKRLASEGKTVIISSHILTELSGFCTHIALMNKGKIVLYGDVNEIQQRLFETKKIHISVVENCDRAAQLAQEYKNTKIVSVKNNEIVVEINAGQTEIADLNSLLVTSGIKVFQFSEEKTDLEDLFMKITSSDEKGLKNDI